MDIGDGKKTNGPASGRVLVTGGSGFVGGRLVDRLLAAGRPVRVFSRAAQPALAARGVEVARGDLADPLAVRNACAGVETVFHVASMVGVWGRYDAFRAVNVVGTQAILNGCHDFGVRRLIYTSTPSVVFNGEDLRGADETLPYGSGFPAHYPATKAVAERAVLQADAPGSLRTVALRPHLIWGVGDKNLIPRVVARARCGRLRIVGSGNNRVDLTHIDNVVDAHMLAERALDAANCPPGGRAYFITNDEPVVLWEWINTLLGRLGLPAVTRRIRLPAARRIGACCETAWRLFRLKGEPPMTRFVAAELAKDHWFTIGAARRDLGYEPRVSMADGLDELVASLLARR